MRIPDTLKKNLQSLISTGDSSHKLSISIALGALIGIIPGAGPVITIIVSVFFRLNKAASLLGCILTNTWVTFLLLAPSIKIGSYILNVKWADVYEKIKTALLNFKTEDIFSIAFLKLILPAIIGYLVISVFFAVIIYFASFYIIRTKRNKTR